MIHIFLTILLFTPISDLADDFTVLYENEPIATVHRSDFNNETLGKEMIDLEKYNHFVNQIDQITFQPPVDAKIDKLGNIVSEQVGHQLHKLEFKKQFYSYYYGRGPLEISIPKQTLHPRVDSELLSDIRVKRIGQYITYFNNRNKPRSHNIKLATEAINNQVIFPGETFSFNRIVGKRTKERGYLPAPVIVRGELSEGIGGGICQVSSTLYNAVDHAGLKIVERYSHSRRVPYVPSGRDATVSWYGPDFVFRNELNQPILLQARIYGGQMSVIVLSSDSIAFEKRKVPGAPKKLPKEIHSEAKRKH
ncbi:vancomycin B-type resistance protein VanW [Halalkalibacter wakoensis JCM 9140]|uniref:Vancomycin B-type resistance protein VanW n=1 Tax=Halalkalibacter wakoensis JCM 9140 TaxID=1236970 RepID=W4PZN2_9BACI|nr:VanW family protein [Halalkalibacter wakoensis]GAE25150.1 vancomycin B-type resistance protein VanW [Halalkalibacter wakoensis JCM 9140]